jgi:hypothetical protein
VAIGRVKSGSVSDRVSLTVWKKSGWVRVGSIYMLYFFRFLIDFDLIEGNLISDRVRSGRIRVRSDSSQVGFESGRINLTFLKN